jgi:hypothetical protein
MVNLIRSSKAAEHSVQLTVGTRRVFLALSFSRFEGESTLPPTAANANRWAAHREQFL